MTHTHEMRVLYLGEMYTIQRVGGITRYFNQIISNMPPAFMPMLTSTWPAKEHFAISNHRLKHFYFPKFRPWRLFAAAETLHARAVMQVAKPNLLHPTYYSFLSRSRNRPSCPVVLTVYDMIHELFPDTSEPSRWTVRAKREAISRADAIICISENTRRDLLGLFPQIEPNTVFVTHLAGGIKLPPAVRSCKTSTRPYFLFVGTRSAPYKNFKTLLQAFAMLVRQNNEVDLRVVGPAFEPDEFMAINDLRIAQSVIEEGHSNEEELAALYQASIALVYPSLYEGFGIPLLEAMTCGTAVVASNTSSIPEVAGEGALFFDPSSAEDMCCKMIQVLEDSTLRNQLIAKGTAQAEKFSWARTAQQTLEVYQQLKN